MIIVPLAALVALILGQRTRAGDLRDAILRGSVLWGSALVLLTELLSAMTLVTKSAVAAGWAIVLGVALIWMFRQSARTPRTPAARVSPGDFDALSLTLIIAIVGVAVVTLALALLAAPATEDSMVYHLPRVMHWIQDQSVAFYPTHIRRQLWPSPGGEFVVLHGQLLTGSDRSVTVIQWFAFLGDIVLSSVVAKQLGAQKSGQLFAAFFFALLPPAVAQASGAQVELIATFWFGCAVVLGLQMMNDRREARSWWSSACLLGAAIGLAILTKTTAFIFLAPFVLWYLWATVRRDPPRAIGSCVVAGLIALALNAPHAARNLAMYDSPLGLPGGNGQLNSVFFPAGFVSNVVRNTSLHFGTRSPRANLALHSSVLGIHRFLGVSPDDPRTTFPGLRYRPVRMEYAEATAGAPIHVLLIGASLLILAWKRGRGDGSALLVLLAVVAGFLMFSFLLRWQPWHSRLWVPLFAVGAGAVGVAFESMARPLVRGAIVGLMMLGVLPALVLNPPRPLLWRTPIYTIPRERQYFAENYRPYTTYRDAADYLASVGCYDIGVWLRGDGEEYQLWPLLQARAARVGRQAHVRHVLVGNESVKLEGRLAGDSFPPCALVFIFPEVPASALPIPVGFNPVWERDSFRIYSMPSEPAPAKDGAI